MLDLIPINSIVYDEIHFLSKNLIFGESKNFVFTLLVLPRRVTARRSSERKNLVEIGPDVPRETMPDPSSRLQLGKRTPLYLVTPQLGLLGVLSQVRGYS